MTQEEKRNTEFLKELNAYIKHEATHHCIDCQDCCVVNCSMKGDNVK